MIISDLNHLESVEEVGIVGGLDYANVTQNLNDIRVAQQRLAVAQNENVGGFFGGSANASSSNSISVSLPLRLFL